MENLQHGSKCPWTQGFHQCPKGETARKYSRQAHHMQNLSQNEKTQGQKTACSNQN